MNYLSIPSSVLYENVSLYLLLIITVLLSTFRPDLIDFENLKRSNAHYNLQNAFNVAEKELGLTKLLDPEGEPPQSPKKPHFSVTWTV